jgi:hypothetical protein
MLPAVGHRDGEIPIEFFVVVFSALTLVGLPRILFCGAVHQKVVALCLAIVPFVILFPME